MHYNAHMKLTRREPANTTISVRFPLSERELYDRIIEDAEKNDRSAAASVRVACREYLERQKEDA